MTFHIGDTVMVNDPMVPKKIPAKILGFRVGADGKNMWLIHTAWGDAWRREDVLSESTRRLINE